MIPGPRGQEEASLDSRAAQLGDALAFWAIAAFCICLLFASYWIPAARKLCALEGKEVRIDSEIHALKEENHHLECRLNGLYNDLYYVERILRRELGFLKEGEEIVKAERVKVNE